MALMEWNPTLSVKVQQFDDQHQQLLAMINELHDAMIAGKGNEVLGKTLDGLISYTTTHFADEENMMAVYDYPDAVAHKVEHENLIRQVTELQQKFNSGATVMTINVLMFLRDWLMDHIHVTDKKYGAFLNTKGVA
jgi:hemerythrin